MSSVTGLLIKKLWEQKKKPSDTQGLATHTKNFAVSFLHLFLEKLLSRVLCEMSPCTPTHPGGKIRCLPLLPLRPSPRLVFHRTASLCRSCRALHASPLTPPWGKFLPCSSWDKPPLPSRSTAPSGEQHTAVFKMTVNGIAKILQTCCSFLILHYSRCNWHTSISKCLMVIYPLVLF